MRLFIIAKLFCDVYCSMFDICASPFSFLRQMDTGFGVLDVPLRRKQLRNLLSSGHTRNVGSWSCRERKKARIWFRLIRFQANIAHAANAQDREEEDEILFDMIKIYMVMTRVPVVSGQ
jgi:hypothetical protein